jgi:N4-gp56 family major capsid protein
MYQFAGIPGLFISPFKLFTTNLRLFDTVPGPVNTTTQTGTGQDLSPEMKTYYDMYLIDNAKPKLVHDQFGQKKPIPKNKGKTIEFRKYSPLPKALTPLTEGVTPQGKSLNVTTVEATVSQFGDYITISDMLELTAIDDNLVQATELLGNQAGETLDTVVRDIINGGTNVIYGQGNRLARYLLVGGEASGNDYFGVENVRLGVRTLKNGKAQPVDGKNYVAIVHPDVVYSLTKDDEWVSANEYAGSENIFAGEIGRIHGVRFVETTEAKIFHAADLTSTSRTLTVASYMSKVITIAEALSSADAAALVGRKIIVDGYLYTVASAVAGSAGSATITISETSTHDPAASDIIYPGEAGAKGRDVYSVLFIGKNAYGVTEVEGGGLETIIKQLGSAGTADPLNQRATSGWKATKVAEILVQEYMVRNEVCTPFESGAN